MDYFIVRRKDLTNISPKDDDGSNTSNVADLFPDDQAHPKKPFMEFHQNDNSTSVLSTTLIVKKINVRDTSKKDWILKATISPASFGISIASIQQVKKIHIYVIKRHSKKKSYVYQI
ncbi:unnamed protein product [Rhizophagus irregularis]|nr:unnamed protein product [Rhizophagus irregularis]